MDRQNSGTDLSSFRVYIDGLIAANYLAIEHAVCDDVRRPLDKYEAFGV